MVAQVSDWHVRLSEPVRARSRHPALDQFLRKSTWFGIATSPFLRDWYRPLSEPVRTKPPLPYGASPYLVELINYIEFQFSVTEIGDMPMFTVATYAPKNLARVTITEIETYTASVTIKEINYTRGYS